MDQVHGAYVGFFLEAMYPEGFTDTSDCGTRLYDLKYGLREVSSIVKRYLPHHDHEDRMREFMERRQDPEELVPFSEVLK